MTVRAYSVTGCVHLHPARVTPLDRQTKLVSSKHTRTQHTLKVLPQKVGFLSRPVHVSGIHEAAVEPVTVVRRGFVIGIVVWVVQSANVHDLRVKPGHGILSRGVFLRLHERLDLMPGGAREVAHLRGHEMIHGSFDSGPQKNPTGGIVQTVRTTGRRKGIVGAVGVGTVHLAVLQTNKIYIERVTIRHTGHER